MSAIDFTYKGIGDLISAGKLCVPANQREYAWDDEHVEALCSDISEALSENKEAYFLGTVVLTKTKDGHLEVVDGQQRLATTTILIAVIRDMLLAMNETRLAHGIEEAYLFGLDLDTEEDTPKFHLNVRDHDFYQRYILPNPSDAKRNTKPAPGTHSNLRIKKAAAVLRQFLENETKAMTVDSRKKYLKDWISYLKENANLIVLTVSDDVNAYVMFETLNDRGLRVSQADLVKNYLFGQSGKRLDEAKVKWSSMIRSLEMVDKEDTAIDYLRLVSTLINGLTRERQVFERIKPLTESPVKAINFLETINSLSNDYVAMLTPNHFKWDSYPESIRKSVATLNLLGVTQIRHLMLAVTHHFSKKEADKSFKLFVSWIVRMFIADSGRVGRLESIYASLAHNIHTKTEIRTAEALVQRMAPHVANDRDFRDAFEKCHVSKSKLARYYLIALEQTADNFGLPEQVPNEDTKAVNLEHILPINPENFDIEPFEDAASYTTRLGNLVILNAKLNSATGNADFASKRIVFADSPFLLTREVANYTKWSAKEIDERQARLADLAVKTWAINAVGRT